MLQLESEAVTGCSDIQFNFTFPNIEGRENKQTRVQLNSLTVNPKIVRGKLAIQMGTLESAQMRTSGKDFLVNTYEFIATTTAATLKSMEKDVNDSERLEPLRVAARGYRDPLLSKFRLSLPAGSVLVSSSYLHLRMLGFASQQIEPAYVNHRQQLMMKEHSVKNYFYVKNPNRYSRPNIFMSTEPRVKDALGGSENFHTDPPYTGILPEDQAAVSPERWALHQKAVAREKDRLSIMLQEELEEQVHFGVMTPAFTSYATRQVFDITIDKRLKAQGIVDTLNKCLEDMFYRNNYHGDHIAWEAKGKKQIVLKRTSEGGLKTTLGISSNESLGKYLGIYEFIVIGANSKSAPVSDQVLFTSAEFAISNDVEIGLPTDYPLTVGCSATLGNSFHSSLGVCSAAGVITHVKRNGIRIISGQDLIFARRDGLQTFSLHFLTSGGQRLYFTQDLQFRASLSVL